MKNIANADRPKSATAMLPPRPFRGSEKVAQTACNSDRREGKSCIPTLNQTFADSRILKISKFRTCRIADVNPRPWTWIALAGAAGLDFPWMQWWLAHGQPVVPSRGRTGVAWTHASRDVVSA